MMTQEQHFWTSHYRSAAIKSHFVRLVTTGNITADELEKLIARRPEVWGRFSDWIAKLPREDNR